MEDNFVDGDRPTVMVTNDDGIDAPGLRALVNVLVSTNRFHVLVCAPDSWTLEEQQPFQFQELQQIVLLWVISGVNMGDNCGYHMVRGKSNVNDFTLAAKACLPIISAILAEIKRNNYPQNCFLNIDVPTDVINHKGYRLTRQGKSFVKMGWRQVNSEREGGKVLSTMTMETNSSESAEARALKKAPQDHLLFKKQVTRILVEDGDTDYCSLREGYITVTPLGGLSPAELDAVSFFQNWLPSVVDHYPSSAL
ncbi:uncharacterized protein LOC107822872 isoform X5 [Nicotiana tabacum]|uniref:Uncharacterized protein LOC107822872 isoform X5 n=1 Tax=Nicotiana tabacum TaxID=4097 RepID=A0A1S4CUY7_TOBAC|nr:PREDICTED: uncharacterized protein LOC107822872 isoform X5 [Nicotiana tabacum]